MQENFVVLQCYGVIMAVCNLALYALAYFMVFLVLQRIIYFNVKLVMYSFLFYFDD